MVIEHFGPQEIDVVLNSIDPSLFFAPPRGKQPFPTVGFVYSKGGLKGVDVALATIDKLRNRLGKVRVVAFGTERPGPPVRLPDWIQITVTPPQDQLRTLYAQCDAWLSASRHEGFNMPALEAMACRTPVVATRTGWPADAFEHRVNGMLAEIDDVDGLTSGLEWVLRLPPEDWKALSANAHATATAGSWEASAKAFEQSLLRACETAYKGEIGRSTAGA
jgi:glycosyltransferase involved in cell wall biosynthesis